MKTRSFFRFCAACAVAALIVAASMTTGCSADSGNIASTDSGGTSGGGSMARFTIAGDYLYTVNNHQLTVVSISNPAKPVAASETTIGTDIETIFTMDTLLFIGSRSAMYIYDISRPEFPQQLSFTSHLRSCDPVVAADTLAFVTLNSSLGTWCGQSRDVLQAYDISDLAYPKLVDEVLLSSPRGLAVDNEEAIVFVCDNGLKAYDYTDPHDMRGLYTAISLPEVGRIDAYDCIILKKEENGYPTDRLLVIGADGLYQLGYDRKEFTFISKIDLRPQE